MTATATNYPTKTSAIDCEIGSIKRYSDDTEFATVVYYNHFLYEISEIKSSNADSIHKWEADRLHKLLDNLTNQEISENGLLTVYLEGHGSITHYLSGTSFYFDIKPEFKHLFFF